MCSTPRSTEPIGSVKYAAVAAVKLLIETEEEEERKKIRRKSRMLIIVLRYGSVPMFEGTIVRIVRLLLPTAVS